MKLAQTGHLYAYPLFVVCATCPFIASTPLRRMCRWSAGGTGVVKGFDGGVFFDNISAFSKTETTSFVFESHYKLVFSLM
jgi:hypothetical protein